MRCDQCRWFRHDDEDPQTGYCYRDPPTALAFDNQIASVRPAVRTSDTCSWHVLRWIGDVDTSTTETH